MEERFKEMQFLSLLREEPRGGDKIMIFKRQALTNQLTHTL